MYLKAPFKLSCIETTLVIKELAVTGFALCISNVASISIPLRNIRKRMIKDIHSISENKYQFFII